MPVYKPNWNEAKNLWGRRRKKPGVTKYTAIHLTTEQYQCPCQTRTEPKISFKAEVPISRSIYSYTAIQSSIFQYHSAIQTPTKPKTSLQALDREKPVFISTMLYRAVFEDTIKLIKLNWAKDCLEGRESKNGGICVYSAIQSSIGKYNDISQTSTEPSISLKAVDWERDRYS